MRLIIFDFDGVIVPGIECSYELFLAQRPSLTLEEYRNWFEGNVHEHLAAKEIVIDLPAFHLAYAERIALLPLDNAIKVLVETLARGATLAIVSSNSGAVIEKYLEHNGVRSAFADVWGSEQHASKKEKILGLLCKHGVLPQDACLVTDTTGDVREAAEVNVSAIGVSWGFHPRERLVLSGAATVVDTPQELACILA